MKKITLLIILTGTVLTNFAQKKSGTVFSEHEAIEKTKELWSAFVNNDKDAFNSFYADTVFVFENGKRSIELKENMAKDIEWWSEEIKNFQVEDHKPAYPDAIDYKDVGTWVQDWLKVSGTHTKTGINLSVHLHNLYSFNKEGKITSIHHYFNNDVFEEIRKSQTIKENGKVYKNHPYINTVRKLLNAYSSENIEALMEFYSSDARFSNTTLEYKETIDLNARKKMLTEEVFTSFSNINLKQIGYPDCIYYEESDNYTVYSWWLWTATEDESDKKIEFPFMINHSFNKEGKVNFEMTYYSSNHFE